MYRRRGSSGQSISNKFLSVTMNVLNHENMFTDLEKKRVHEYMSHIPRTIYRKKNWGIVWIDVVGLFSGVASCLDDSQQLTDFGHSCARKVGGCEDISRKIENLASHSPESIQGAGYTITDAFKELNGVKAHQIKFSMSAYY